MDDHQAGDVRVERAVLVGARDSRLRCAIRFEELTPDEFRGETAGTWPRPVVDMLLDAWAATMGRPAFVTATVSGILGSARPFRRWVADHATAFT